MAQQSLGVWRKARKGRGHLGPSLVLVRNAQIECTVTACAVRRRACSRKLVLMASKSSRASAVLHGGWLLGWARCLGCCRWNVLTWTGGAAIAKGIGIGKSASFEQDVTVLDFAHVFLMFAYGWGAGRLGACSQPKGRHRNSDAASNSVMLLNALAEGGNWPFPGDWRQNIFPVHVRMHIVYPVSVTSAAHALSSLGRGRARPPRHQANAFCVDLSFVINTLNCIHLVQPPVGRECCTR
jgi:hypothetical protein